MAGLERWYQKFEALDDDSDTEARAAPEPLDAYAQRMLKGLPPDIAESVRQTPNPRTREALLAVNCFVSELHRPLQKTPAAQQQLLRVLSTALKALEEGGEVETLLFRVCTVLRHPEISAGKVGQALGACALLGNVDKRLVLAIAHASSDRVGELATPCLARVCWSAASLASSEVRDDALRLLRKALELAERRLADFVPEDASLLAWACATARPEGAEQLLRGLVKNNVPDSSPNGHVVSWALASFSLIDLIAPARDLTCEPVEPDCDCELELEPSLTPVLPTYTMAPRTLPGPFAPMPTKFVAVD